MAVLGERPRSPREIESAIVLRGQLQGTLKECARLRKEVQTVSVPAVGSHGQFFRLQFRGMLTGAITVGTTKLSGDATSVQSMLSSVLTVGTVRVVPTTAVVKCASCATALSADRKTVTVNEDLTQKVFAMCA